MSDGCERCAVCGKPWTEPATEPVAWVAVASGDDYVLSSFSEDRDEAEARQISYLHQGHKHVTLHPVGPAIDALSEYRGEGE